MEAGSTSGQTLSQPEQEGMLPPGAWDVVADESVVGFQVKKLGLYFVKGRFRDVRGHIVAGPIGTDARGEVVIQARSVTTRMPPRDLHLRTADFLAVERHPEIRISVESARPGGKGAFVVPTTFEIRGQRRQVELIGHAHPDEHERQARIHLTGTLQREDFGIRPVPPVRSIVGADVHLDAQLVLERAG